jgi:hypothetical protein
MTKSPNKKGKLPKGPGSKQALIRHVGSVSLDANIISILQEEQEINLSFLQEASSWGAGEEMTIQRASWRFDGVGANTEDNSYEIGPPVKMLVVAYEGTLTVPRGSTNLRTVDDILDDAISGDLAIVAQSPWVYPQIHKLMSNFSSMTNGVKAVEHGRWSHLLDLTEIFRRAAKRFGNPLINEADSKVTMLLLWSTVPTTGDDTYAISFTSSWELHYLIRQRNVQLAF